MDHGLRLESDRLAFGIAPDVNIAVWRSAICRFNQWKQVLAINNPA